jgi:hypothetical protein
MIKNNIKNLSVVLVIVIATIIQTINGSINNMMVTKVLGQSDFEDAFAVGGLVGLDLFKAELLDEADGPPGSGAPDFFVFLDNYNLGNLTLFAPINAIFWGDTPGVSDNKFGAVPSANKMQLLLNHIADDLIDVPVLPTSGRLELETKQPLPPGDGSNGFQFTNIVAVGATDNNPPGTFALLIFGAPVDGTTGVSPMFGTIPPGAPLPEGTVLTQADYENTAGSTIRIFTMAGAMQSKSFTDILVDANLTDTANLFLTLTGIDTELDELEIGTLVFPDPDILKGLLESDDDDEESDSTPGALPGNDVVSAFKRLFASHIIPGQRLKYSDFFGLNGQTLDTLDEHTKITVEVAALPGNPEHPSGLIRLNGVDITASQTNLVSSQGVMHILGGVLQPAEIPFTRAPAPDSSATQGVFVNASMFLFALSAIIATMF